MNVREKLELAEEHNLSSYAALSKFSLGRQIPESECELRTAFQRDRDRILHCKSFRRLKHKTQVFLSPEGDHYRTRLTHTLEVSQVARTIARSLSLNEDLTEAISLAHDLGHTPFGHAGERALNDIMPKGFLHFEQSVRVVQKLENNGKGLNLTEEVINGIRCHTKGEEASTLEGKVVKLADRIAFINHDVDDALRAGILTFDDIPSEALKALGEKRSVRINTLISSIVENSQYGQLKMDPNIQRAFDTLFRFMYDTVYVHPIAKKEEDKIPRFISYLFRYFMSNPNELPDEIIIVASEDGLARAVCDYIAGMTDDYAIKIFNSLFVPKSWNK